MRYRSKDVLLKPVLSRPLQGRLLGSALVLACLILPLSLFVIDAVESYYQALADGKRELETTSEILEQHAHNVFETYQLALNLLDEHTRGKSWEELESAGSLHDYLSQLVQDYPQIGGLALIDPHGFIRVSSFPVPNPPPNFADRSYFADLRDRDLGTYIGERVHSRIEGGDKLNIVRRRAAAGGRFDGVLLVNVKPATAFIDFWQNQPDGSVTSLVRLDGRFLARYPKADRDITQMRANGPGMKQVLADGRAYALVESPIDHKERMMVFQRVHGFPVVLIHGAPRSALLAPWRAGLFRNALRYGGATLGLVLMACSVTAVLRRLLAHTETLTGEVQRRERAEADLADVLLDLIERQEADRKRIAQDLHDGLGHHVALLHMNIDAMGKAPYDVHLMRQKIAQQKVAAKEISQEVSRIAWELRPVWLDDMGLDAAVRSFIAAVQERSGLDFHIDIALGERRFGDMVEATVYRVLQEAIANIVKHAQASHVDIIMDIFRGTLRLIIEDNGKGFPAPAGDAVHSAPSPRGGLGLRGMRERLSLIKGSLSIETEPDNGTALTICIPA